MRITHLIRDDRVWPETSAQYHGFCEGTFGGGLGVSIFAATAQDATSACAQYNAWFVVLFALTHLRKQVGEYFFSKVGIANVQGMSTRHRKEARRFGLMLGQHELGAGTSTLCLCCCRPFVLDRSIYVCFFAQGPQRRAAQLHIGRGFVAAFR